MEPNELFEKHGDEFGKFERIPLAERKHAMRDLCAMLYLYERFGGTHKAVEAAEHDVIYPAAGCEKLTEDDVIYLARCGVHWDSEVDCLAMFV